MSADAVVEQRRRGRSRRSRASASRTVRSGPGRGLLGHQVAQRGVAVLVDRGVQADVLAAPRHQVEDPVDVHAELGGDLVRLGVAAELALEGAAGAADLVELLDHVHGEPDDAGLLGDAAGDRLAHPPGGVGRELVALGVVELLDRADQAGVALLDQVEHRHLRAAVLAGDRDDQPQVGLDERVDGLAALLGEPLELLLGGASSGRRPCGGRRGRSSSRCSAIRPASMVLESSTSVLGVEQRGAGDLVEVQPDAVAALDLASAARRLRCVLPCRRLLFVGPQLAHLTSSSNDSVPGDIPDMLRSPHPADVRAAVSCRGKILRDFSVESQGTLAGPR